VVDPRTSIIDERMKGISNIIAVSGGKGGVGKSLVASILAVTLVKKGYRVGLFDLDFTSPSTHVILGFQGIQPKEEKGIVPPKIHGLQYMSIIYYSGDFATPLRGVDVSNALIELLSITKWEELDYLILDMPPGISDATLDLLRLIKNIRFLIVTTPSKLAFETVRKLSSLLIALKVSIIGILENMKTNQSTALKHQTEKLGLTYLGHVRYDRRVESFIGDTDRLLKTNFAKEVQRITSQILSTNAKYSHRFP
jgi:ATP-binding protein involved in chromosome partitioning